MFKSDPYKKHFVVLDKDDIDNLLADEPVHIDGDEYCPPETIVTKEGYRKLKEFQGNRTRPLT